MNAGLRPYAPRAIAASNQAREILAAWLKVNRAPKAKADPRLMLLQRYPLGLLDEAELEALLKILYE
ncbi:hypothetical protein RRX38_15195 [Pseudomonas sp. DTU_2021_1001937_2_SI_NGA_ILE_001]|uniref:hypothetical protein n=1 Tax=Pseudomonas sp. DTU_2021_1001937_2_SI_NGA_ILE_001 TaxID=3077589 RepID=UPI0028FC1320|nr:hypothetical protein [Pseudomonas sp. DTU_2021_1001937_2_SI_NGA_ILE_001]WNW12433.1 hypothetical protein RRX38_15195 [Pseudomonas sp. DTU_2021_1001937_2_SI_NGA_ILE_001]